MLSTETCASSAELKLRGSVPAWSEYSPKKIDPRPFIEKTIFAASWAASMSSISVKVVSNATNVNASDEALPSLSLRLTFPARQRN